MCQKRLCGTIGIVLAKGHNTTNWDIIAQPSTLIEKVFCLRNIPVITLQTNYEKINNS